MNIPPAITASARTAAQVWNESFARAASQAPQSADHLAITNRGADEATARRKDQFVYERVWGAEQRQPEFGHTPAPDGGAEALRGVFLSAYRRLLNRGLNYRESWDHLRAHEPAAWRQFVCDYGLDNPPPAGSDAIQNRAEAPDDEWERIQADVARKEGPVLARLRDQFERRRSPDFAERHAVLTPDGIRRAFEDGVRNVMGEAKIGFDEAVAVVQKSEPVLYTVYVLWNSQV